MKPSGAHSPVVQFGKYMLVERLGRGGMAEVWKSKIVGPAGFERTLVIKRILPHLVEDPRFVQMFVAEARLSARLNHANIVQVFELGDVDGEFFLAMEYVRGRDLVSTVRQQLQRGLPPPGLGAFVVREVCRALGYAHALHDENGQPLRLIHRDVSPSNVMLSFDGAVKLLDFGIAKALAEANENKTQTGTLKGKFGYMSPEQVEGKDIDHRADLFAAGIVLHEVLTGRRLFKGQNDLQTIAMVREGKVDPPSTLNDQVPPELDRICLKALAKSREDRYASCDEMAVELDDVVHHLKWGPERLGAAMKELFPEEPSQTGQIVLIPSETAAGSNLTIGALRRHERKRNVAFGASVLALLGGVAWLIAAKVGPDQPEPPKEPIKQEVKHEEPKPVQPPPASAPAPTMVVVNINSTPDRAIVFRDDFQVGMTPYKGRVERSADTVKYKVVRDGYAPQEIAITPDEDKEFDVRLEKLAVADHGSKSKTRPPKVNDQKPKQPKPTAVAGSKDDKPTKHEPRESIKTGGIVDPFAD